MATKMTRTTALEVALTAIKAVMDENLMPLDCDNLEEATSVITHMREQLAKPKAKTEGTKTKARIENEAIANRLYTIAPEVAFDSKFVMERTTAMTPQKVVGIMAAGIELGLFEKLKDGKRTVYRKVG